MNRRIWCGLFSAVALSACTSPSSENTVGPEKVKEKLHSHVIAYNVLEDEANDNYDVYVMNPDGSEVKNITNTPGVDWVYGSHKNRLLMVSDKDTTHRTYFLYSVSNDGKDWKKLYDKELPDNWVSMHPDGKTVALSVQENGVFNLALLNIETGELKKITNDGLAQKDPAFSPDGKEMAYRIVYPMKMELWLYDLESGNHTKITERVNESGGKLYGYLIGPPRWHPSGGSLCFIGLENGQHRILQVPKEGGPIEMLIDAQGQEGWFGFHPDGTGLVFDSERAGGYDIYTHEFSNQETKRLTADDRYEMAPVYVEN